MGKIYEIFIETVKFISEQICYDRLPVPNKCNMLHGNHTKSVEFSSVECEACISFASLIDSVLLNEIEFFRKVSYI